MGRWLLPRLGYLLNMNFDGLKWIMDDWWIHLSDIKRCCLGDPPQMNMFIVLMGQSSLSKYSGCSIAMLDCVTSQRWRFGENCLKNGGFFVSFFWLKPSFKHHSWTFYAPKPGPLGSQDLLFAMLTAGFSHRVNKAKFIGQISTHRYTMIKINIMSAEAFILLICGEL